MNKRIAVLLCGCLLFCFASCGKVPVAESGAPSSTAFASGIGYAAEVDGGDFAYTAKVAYANYAEDTRILSACLNSDSMYISSVRHLPLFKFASEAEMQAFKTTFADTLTFAHGYDEVPSFDQVAAAYDDAFFQTNTLLLCYVGASSGSYRYGVADVSVREDTLYLYVEQLNHPEVTTANMAGWFVLVEVRKADVENCKQFDAQVYQSDVSDSITADYDGDGKEE